MQDSNNETRTGQILGIAGAFHLLALSCVGLRTYARFIRLKTAGNDDVAMLVCAILAIAGFLCFCVEAKYGLGRHIASVSTADLVTFNKIVFYQSIISATCGLGMLRVSIAMSLLRLNAVCFNENGSSSGSGHGGGVAKRWYAYSLISLIAFIILYSLFSLLTLFLHCSPLHGHWDFRVHAHCYDITLFTYFGVVVNSCNIATDVLLALLPVPFFWHLRLPLRTRLYLVLVFGLGYLAVAMGAVKVYYQVTTIGISDKTFTSSVSFWGFLQLNTGILAACAPTLRPILTLCLKLRRRHHRQEAAAAQEAAAKAAAEARRAALRAIEDVELACLAGEEVVMGLPVLPPPHHDDVLVSGGGGGGGWKKGAAALVYKYSLANTSSSKSTTTVGSSLASKVASRR